jgi:hypothetical protein
MIENTRALRLSNEMKQPDRHCNPSNPAATRVARSALKFPPPIVSSSRADRTSTAAPPEPRSAEHIGTGERERRLFFFFPGRVRAAGAAAASAIWVTGASVVAGFCANALSVAGAQSVVPRSRAGDRKRCVGDRTWQAVAISGPVEQRLYLRKAHRPVIAATVPYYGTIRGKQQRFGHRKAASAETRAGMALCPFFPLRRISGTPASAASTKSSARSRAASAASSSPDQTRRSVRVESLVLAGPPGSIKAAGSRGQAKNRSSANSADIFASAA